MDLRQLEIFAEVARRGNFTRAAEALHLAQPAVSMAIRKLEAELEVRLFDRRPRQAVLTAEGRALRGHAEPLLARHRDACLEMAELRGLNRGEVRVGIPPMMSSYYFPRLIREFRERRPGLRLAVHGAGAARIQHLIAAGGLDLGVIAGVDVPAGLEGRLLVREEIVACVPAGHRFARAGAVTLAGFLAEPLVLFEQGYHMRELMDELLAEVPGEPQVVFETNLFTLVRNVVKQGLGISTLLRMAIADDPALAAVPFEPPLYLDLRIAWKAGGYLSLADRAFLEFLAERSGADRGPEAAG